MASNAYSVHHRPEDIEAEEARKAALRLAYLTEGKWWRVKHTPIRRIALVTLDGEQRTVTREKDGSYRVQVGTGTYRPYATFHDVYHYLLQARRAGPYRSVIVHPTREHMSHKVRKPAPKGRIVIASQFVHPDIQAHVLTTYWQQVRYWDGMAEARRRSQSCPGWLRWETIVVKPQAAQKPTLTLVQTTVTEVAAELGEEMRPAAEIVLPSQRNLLSQLSSFFNRLRLFPQKTPKHFTNLTNTLTIRAEGDDLWLYHEAAPDKRVKVGFIITEMGQRRWTNERLDEVVREFVALHGVTPTVHRYATVEDGEALLTWIEAHWQDDPRPTPPDGYRWGVVDGYISLSLGRASVDVAQEQAGVIVSASELRNFIDRTGGLTREVEVAA